MDNSRTPYLTHAELIARYSERTVRGLADPTTKLPAEQVTAIIETKISDASELVDSMLGGRYAMPIAGGVPSLLKQYISTIALFRLYDSQTHVPENVIKSHEDAMQRLRAIRDGKETIDLPLATATESREGAGAEFISGSPNQFALNKTMGGNYGRG